MYLARSTGLSRLPASDRTVVAEALEGLDVAFEGRTVAGVRTMAATEFRTRCYRLMDEVAEKGREVVITKRGKPVARLVAVRRRRGAPFGLYRDEIRIHGDIGAPIDVEWNAEVNPDRVLDP